VRAARRWLALAAVVMLAGCTAASLPAAAPSPRLPDALLGPGATQVVVEVSAVDGRVPSTEVFQDITRELARITGKQVYVLKPTSVPEQGGDYRAKDLERIHRDTSFFAPEAGFLSGQRIVLHLLVLDGAMASDDTERMTLGRSLLHSGIVAMFPDGYRDAVTRVNGTWEPARDALDRYVLLHELGHCLGLVGNGVPMVRDHVAPGHPGHGNNPKSVMYYHPPMAPGARSVGAIPVGYDADDLDDLAAHRARLAAGAGPLG
jgi:hypothetical protein